jgi:hypothetical protein
MSSDAIANPSLKNPFAEVQDRQFSVPGQVATTPGLYEEALEAGWELQQRPRTAAAATHRSRRKEY